LKLWFDRLYGQEWVKIQPDAGVATVALDAVQIAISFRISPSWNAVGLGLPDTYHMPGHCPLQ
jgi:hypothetical protein